MAATRLTVIIPGYNNPDEKWRRCIQSVLANLQEVDEVICVDDGSTSRPGYLEEISVRDSRVKVLYLEQNQGLSQARNLAVKQAKGRLVTFVDSDDELFPGVYDEAVAKLDETRADIALFGVRSIWPAERLYKVNVPPARDFGSLGVLDVKWLYENSLLNYAWNKIYRKEFLNRNSILFDNDGVPCEDIIFVLTCILHGARWIGVPQEGIKYYRAHNTLLSRYKKTYTQGTLLANKTWQEYKRKVPNAGRVLGDMGEISEGQMARAEWNNIWRMGSPYSLKERLRFAQSRAELSGGHPVLFFMKKLIASWLRKWFYGPIVQRWHIRRTYPEVKGF